MTQTIINWYLQHKRDLPWRETQDPYHIWISEIILQQTRVAQGLDYYIRFISRFPYISDLAQADEDEVLRMWQGLGYYSRARNIHAAARDIMSRFDGQFPTTYKDIRSLKGIGPYTAAAIASFAYRLPHAAVDGNVYRVLSRLFDIDIPIDSTEGKKLFEALAEELLDKKHPDLFNQAMMEFGA
ncbi:MAG: A/G-specific adenine glycosylase, partial [Bacteroidales bacterium]